MNTLSRFDTVLSSLVFPRLKSDAKASASTTPSEADGSQHTSQQRLRLSNLPPTPRRRKIAKRRHKPTTTSIKLPPPSTPWLLRIALALWSILLSFWTSLVGETRASRVSRKKYLNESRTNRLLRTLKDGAGIGGGGVGGASSDEGEASASDGEGGTDDEALDTSPVTQTDDTSPIDQPDDSEFLSPPAKSHRESFSFRLRSADNKPPATQQRETQPTPSTQSYLRTNQPASILSNPIKKANRLLPNPMATSMLDASVPVKPLNLSSPSVPVPAPRPHQTPFHHQKTLILDLDETLIHSTSRPMSYAASAGGGLLGLSFGGLFGGRRSRREGHTVEVVLNGRSTTYYVYKRPYVDHFLKKVRIKLMSTKHKVRTDIGSRSLHGTRL